MLQVLPQIHNISVHCDFVLPLKLCPHLAKLGVCTGGRHYVVHYVNMDVV